MASPTKRARKGRNAERAKKAEAAAVSTNLQETGAAVPLLHYQKAWVLDPSRFKMGLWARQTGKSFSTSLEAVLDCDERKTDWVFLSSGERQAKELIRKARMHALALDAAYGDLLETDYKAGSGTVFKQLEIEFKNGSRIIALPANPDTARGHSANLVLDEFAFHQDSTQIWKALFPTVTRGYKLRIISTPQGKKNKFYHLWSGNPRYSKHRVTIWDAHKMGLPIFGEDGEATNPEFLREALDDAEAWLQEYECEFVDEATAWIPYELIAACEEATLTDDNERRSHLNAVYAGIDIGRKKDITIYWSLEKVGDVLWSLRKVELERMPFRLQFNALLAQIAKDRPLRVCVDNTGLGAQIAEDLKFVLGSTVEEITFRNAVKEELAITAKRKFEDRLLRLPVDKKTREDIHNVKKSVTASGNIRFDAERTKDGHSDRFWGLALAIHASEGPVSMADVTVGKRRESYEFLKSYGT